MNGYSECLIKEAIKAKKFNVITECSKIINPDKNEIIIEEYSGNDIRVFKNKDKVCVLYPKDDTYVAESEYLEKAIASGEIFDDADRVENASSYIIRTGLPIDSIERQGIASPEPALMPVVGPVIGTVNNDCVDCDETELRNGYAIMKDVMTGGSGTVTPHSMIKNYMNLKDEDDVPKIVASNMFPFDQAMNELQKYDDNEALPDDDIIDSVVGDGEEPDPAELEHPVEESFFSKKPKKLKPIPARDIISYITVEINAIQDTNDQAMLASYTCSKLEVADFYLSCLETDDSRYIVPHTRQFLVDYQNNLNRLLTNILKLKPANKNDRAWKIDVKYPEGWRG